MAKITQNRPSEKINTGFGQSGKKFCGHKNVAKEYQINNCIEDL